MDSGPDLERIEQCRQLRGNRENVRPQFWRGTVLDFLVNKVLPTSVRVLLRTRPFRAALANSRQVHLAEMTLEFAELPPAFEGYRILQVSDLHFGNVKGQSEVLRELLAPLEADLGVFTGDFASHWRDPWEHVIPEMEALLAAVKPRDGWVGILGNHDPLAMVEPLWRCGIRFLINDSVTLRREGQAIHLTGVDDVHIFHSPAAEAALATSPEGFKIALVHSPELAEEAARAGFALYLAGHTHWGQISLPGGKPIFTALHHNHHLATGLWRHEDMIGYTTSGVGTSKLPLRLNTRGEVVLFRLRRRAA